MRQTSVAPTARSEQGASFYYQNGVQAEPDSAPRVSSPEADSMNLDLLCRWFDRRQNVGRQFIQLDIDLLGHKLYNFDIGLLAYKRDAAISCLDSSATFFIGTGPARDRGIRDGSDLLLSRCPEMVGTR